MNIFKIAFSWFLSLFTSTYRMKSVESDLPTKLKSNTLYVVHEDGFLEHAAMLCPCGCTEILQMNLIPDERPLWKLTKHENGTVSLYPSVWRKKGCNSHFWLRNSHIKWCDF